jgi:hypothetical protein
METTDNLLVASKGEIMSKTIKEAVSCVRELRMVRAETALEFAMNQAKALKASKPRTVEPIHEAPPVRVARIVDANDHIPDRPLLLDDAWFLARNGILKVAGKQGQGMKALIPTFIYHSSELPDDEFQMLTFYCDKAKKARVRL